MKAIVLKTYRDKNTKEVHKAGDVIDITAARFKELEKAAGGPFVKKQGGSE